VGEEEIRRRERDLGKVKVEPATRSRFGVVGTQWEKIQRRAVHREAAAGARRWTDDDGLTTTSSHRWIEVRFTTGTSLAGGGGVVVGTLKTGYPRIQALSQEKEQSVHPRAAT
jgi:hypothetical protein